MSRHMNMAMLMNQAWRHQQQPNMLWAQVLKAKYFPHTNVFQSVRTPQGSHIWKALHEGIQLLQRGMRWILGDGQTIQVWEDHWIPKGTLQSHIVGPLMPNEVQRLVCSLQNNHAWTLDFLQVLFPVQLKQLIKGIPVVQLTRIFDSFVWPHNNGICSVRLASKYLYQQAKVPINKQLWNWIWKLHCH